MGLFREQGGNPLIPCPIVLNVPNKPYGFCGPKAPCSEMDCVRAQELCEQGGGSVLSFPIPLFPIPNKPYGFCGRKAPCNEMDCV